MQKYGEESGKRGRRGQEIGANKVIQKVREKSKKIMNCLTNHGQSHCQDLDHEEEYDEQEPE